MVKVRKVRGKKEVRWGRGVMAVVVLWHVACVKLCCGAVASVVRSGRRKKS